MESKELEALDNVELELFDFETKTQKCEKDIDTIKNALTEKQDLEKFTRLVIEKKIDIVSLNNALSFKQYNSYISFKIAYQEYMKLTQAEFNFAKEMVEKYE